MFSDFFKTTVLLLALVALLSPAQAQDACVTQDREEGQCVSLLSCPALVALVRRKPIPEDVKAYLRRAQCGYQGNQPKVCCSGFAPSLGNRAPPSSVATSPLLPDRSQCGESPADKVVGGEQAEIDEFPWTALVEYSRPGGRGFYCGGALISSRYVITAAHCVNGKGVPRTYRIVSVRLGEWNTDTEEDCDADLCSDSPLDVPVEAVTVHPGYQSANSSQAHDIALLRLAAPVQFTSWIKPVCLPNAREQSSSLSGQRLWVAGWGRTETSSAAAIKQKLDVPVLPLSSCSNSYRRLGVQLGEGQVCAGGERGRDSCRGDSGGPLMGRGVGVGGVWYLAGLVSFGPSPCGQENWPGVYTKVGSYVDWISSTLRP